MIDTFKMNEADILNETFNMDEAHIFNIQFKIFKSGIFNIPFKIVEADIFNVPLKLVEADIFDGTSNVDKAKLPIFHFSLSETIPFPADYYSNGVEFLDLFNCCSKTHKNFPFSTAALSIIVRASWQHRRHPS